MECEIRGLWRKNKTSVSGRMRLFLEVPERKECVCNCILGRGENVRKVSGGGHVGGRGGGRHYR